MAAIFTMIYINRDGHAMFCLMDKNFDVLETRMMKRLLADGVSKGTVRTLKDGRCVAEGDMVTNPAW